MPALHFFFIIVYSTGIDAGDGHGGEDDIEPRELSGNN